MTIFDAFGGTRAMADHLREPPSTVQSWKTAGRIPAGKQPSVLEKAEKLGLPISAEDVIFPLGRHPEVFGGHCPRCDEHVDPAAAISCGSDHCPLRVAHIEAEAA